MKKLWSLLVVAGLVFASCGQKPAPEVAPEEVTEEVATEVTEEEVAPIEEATEEVATEATEEVAE